MNNEQLAAYILKWVSAVIGSLGGVTGIIVIVKTLIKSKSAKMSAKDKSDIAELAAKRVIEGQNLNIELDISEQIDKATNKRLKAVEDSTNDFIRLINKVIKQQRHIASAVKDFKTISTESRSQLLEDLDDVEETAETVVNPNAAKVAVAAKIENKIKESY